MEKSDRKFEHLRRSVASGIVFSATVVLCSVAYAAYTAIPNNKVSGNHVSSSEWNAVANGLSDHESRIASLEGATNARKILQVANAMKNDTWSAVTTGNNFYTVPGLSVTLTPTSSNSKFLISPALFAGTTNYQIKYRILRNGTPVVLGAGEGGRPQATGVIIPYDDVVATQQYRMAFIGGSYVDAPASASPVTYEIQMAAYDTKTVYLNRSPTWQSGASQGYDATPVSSLTVMEIAN
ncbi:MAG: hypothetical protein QMC36_08485 [Patescibacteria group bacterium]